MSNCHFITDIIKVAPKRIWHLSVKLKMNFSLAFGFYIAYMYSLLRISLQWIPLDILLFIHYTNKLDLTWPVIYYPQNNIVRAIMTNLNNNKWKISFFLCLYHLSSSLWSGSDARTAEGRSLLPKRNSPFCLSHSLVLGEMSLYFRLRWEMHLFCL